MILAKIALIALATVGAACIFSGIALLLSVTYFWTFGIPLILAGVVLWGGLAL